MNEMKVEVKRIVLDGEKYEAKRVQAMKKISKGLSDKKEYISRRAEQTLILEC